MNLFFWKDNKDIDIFATNVANDFFSVVQPKAMKSFFKSSSKDKEAKKNRKNTEKNIAIAIQKIQQFRATKSLGTYGKARLQLTFNRRLQELGYDDDMVSQLNDFILVRMT